MPRRSGRSYTFALVSSAYISIAALIIGIFFVSQTSSLRSDWLLFLGMAVIFYIVCFLILQYRLEAFIYTQIQKIYKDVSALEASDIAISPDQTNLNVLSQQVEKFAKAKKEELDVLKGQDQFRKEFMGNISHELKTPLFTVQGYILTLIDGAAENKSIRKKYLNRAAKGVERLIYIVKDLDVITRLELGDMRLEYEVFDIRELIKAVFDLLEMKAAKKNITLIFDHDYRQPIYVEADRERIQQVVTNLIVNSIKYGKEEGTTEVSLVNRSGNRLQIHITDNGEGIGKEHLPRLFERFYRVDKSGSRKEGGSGLGLAIVKHIIEAHRQKIQVESDLGVGSDFSFTLKKAEIEEE